MTSLQEAFQKLSLLEEEEFDIDIDDLEAAEDFAAENSSIIAANNANDETVEVIDPEAMSEEDIEDSYVGKVILDCCVCHSKVYKPALDVTVDFDADVVNVGEECPYCYSSDGFKIIGQVQPFEPETEADDEAVKDDIDEVIIDDERVDDPTDTIDNEEDELEESLITEATDLFADCYIDDDLPAGIIDDELSESLNSIDLATDTENIHIEAAPNEEDLELVSTVETEEPAGEDIIGNVDAAVQDTIMGDGPDPTELEPVDGEATIDIDMSDIDEDEFSELGERYLRTAYSNVKYFKLTEARLDNKRNRMFLEGTITFRSGKKGVTTFVFEAASASKRGTVVFKGFNKQLYEATDRNDKALILRGRVTEGKLSLKSMSYKYSQQINEKLEKITGTVHVQ